MSKSTTQKRKQPDENTEETHTKWDPYTTLPPKERQKILKSLNAELMTHLEEISEANPIGRYQCGIVSHAWDSFVCMLDFLKDPSFNTSPIAAETIDKTFRFAESLLKEVVRAEFAVLDLKKSYDVTKKMSFSLQTIAQNESPEMFAEALWAFFVGQRVNSTDDPSIQTMLDRIKSHHEQVKEYHTVVQDFDEKLREQSGALAAAQKLLSQIQDYKNQVQTEHNALRDRETALWAEGLARCQNDFVALKSTLEKYVESRHNISAGNEPLESIVQRQDARISFLEQRIEEQQRQIDSLLRLEKVPARTGVCFQYFDIPPDAVHNRHLEKIVQPFRSTGEDAVDTETLDALRKVVSRYFLLNTPINKFPLRLAEYSSDQVREYAQLLEGPEFAVAVKDSYVLDKVYAAILNHNIVNSSIVVVPDVAHFFLKAHYTHRKQPLDFMALSEFQTLCSTPERSPLRATYWICSLEGKKIDTSLLINAGATVKIVRVQQSVLLHPHQCNYDLVAEK